MIAEHIEHVLNIGGEDACAIGTDLMAQLSPERLSIRTDVPETGSVTPDRGLQKL